MAAITTIDMGAAASKLLETIAITNQATDTVVTRKAVAVPSWARYATIVIKLTMTGTSPLFDFALEGADTVGTPGAPNDSAVWALGGWDGITQKTSATNQYITIDIGPTLAADDTGSATASDRYGVQAALPPWLVYKYTTDGTTDDEDYAGTISIYFFPGP